MAKHSRPGLYTPALHLYDSSIGVPVCNAVISAPILSFCSNGWHCDGYCSQHTLMAALGPGLPVAILLGMPNTRCTSHYIPRGAAATSQNGAAPPRRTILGFQLCGGRLNGGRLYAWAAMVRRGMPGVVQRYDWLLPAAASCGCIMGRREGMRFTSTSCMLCLEQLSKYHFHGSRMASFCPLASPGAMVGMV